MTDAERRAKAAESTRKWKAKNAEALKAYRQRPDVKAAAREATAKYRKKVGPEPDRIRAKAYYAKNSAALAAAALARYHENPEVRGVYRRGYYRRTREKALDYSKRYRLNNLSACALRGKAYKAKNRRRINDALRLWRTKNPELARRHIHTRRSRLRGGEISKQAIGFLLKSQRWSCVNCRAPLKETGYHIDHIMPLSLGGKNSDSNIQLLCPSCNLTKSAKHPIDWAQSQGRLL